MRIDPQVGALRGNEASQRVTQEALEAVRDAWLQGPAKAIMADLRSYGEGRDLAACPDLASLFEIEGQAKHQMDALVAPMLAKLAQHPLGHVPLRHQFSDNLSIIEVAKHGRAALTLIAYDEFDIEQASASFGGGERHEIVLAGAADVLLVELLDETQGTAAMDCMRRRIVTGETLHSTNGRTTRLVQTVHGRLVMLRLARTEEVPGETRQYSLEDGRLLHKASGSRIESRQEMAMALLGRMGRADAAPVLAELAQEGSDHIRWQSVRECLALDTATGFLALSKIAGDPADTLSAPARALRARLVEAYPQLRQLETNPCPA